MLLTWLGALPEPLFPPALVPALVESQQSDYYEERVASMRALLKQVCAPTASNRGAFLGPAEPPEAASRSAAAPPPSAAAWLGWERR